MLSGGSAGDADGVAAALVARGLEEESQRLLDDPLIRAHRRIVRGAPLTDVREAWKQNADVARQLATCARAGAASRAERGGGAGAPGAPAWRPRRRYRLTTAVPAGASARASACGAMLRKKSLDDR